LSNVHDSAIAPARLTSPYVGRSPVTPQYAAGVTIEPDVSDPNAYATNPAATAAPDPLDDPPDQRPVSHGFNPGPVAEAAAYRYPPPPANSTIANLPRQIAPALSNFFTTVACSSNTCPAYGLAPQPVGKFAKLNRSFAP
jgi:hypothetical protein